MSVDGEVNPRGVFSGSAAVFVERHVQRPVEDLDPQWARVAARMALGSGSRDQM